MGLQKRNPVISRAISVYLDLFLRLLGLFPSSLPSAVRSLSQTPSRGAARWSHPMYHKDRRKLRMRGRRGEAKPGEEEKEEVTLKT